MIAVKTMFARFLGGEKAQIWGADTPDNPRPVATCLFFWSNGPLNFYNFGKVINVSVVFVFKTLYTAAVLNGNTMKT